MALRLIIILSIIALAEYYTYIVIHSSVQNTAPLWRNIIFGTYVTLTALTWLGFVSFIFRLINWAAMPHLLRNIYIGLVLGFTVGKILVLLVMLVDDLRRLITWLITSLAYGNTAQSGTPTNTIERSVFLKRTALVLGGLAVLGFTWGIKNRYSYRVRKVKLKLDGTPESFKGLRIVQISDIHTGSFDNHSAVAHGIERIMDQKPDLIFFTGDLVNNQADEVDEQYQEIYSRLKAPMGVYSTLGNHDYGDYVQWPSQEHKKANLDRLKKIHGDMGWRLLLNEHIVLERGTDKMAVIGVENISARANFHSYGDMSKAVAGLKEKNVPLKILLSHDPSHWHAQVVPQFSDVQLTLSGHTHGMQFGLDNSLFKWSPVQYMYKEWAGLYTQGAQNLYVNRGFGFLGYPGRLGVMPEITVFELA